MQAAIIRLGSLLLASVLLAVVHGKLAKKLNYDPATYIHNPHRHILTGSGVRLGHRYRVPLLYNPDVARLMEETLMPTETCGTGCCVEVTQLRTSPSTEPRTETVLVRENEEVLLDKNHPCQVYVCMVGECKAGMRKTYHS